jgi:TM2 domain-containing membrane protein YozV
MMSPALVAFVGVIYGYIAAEQFYLSNPSMGVVYLGYAFSNIGLWVLVR